MSIADDVRAAATEVGSAPTTESVPVPAVGPGTGNQSVEPSGTAETGTRARDESGRFATKAADKPEATTAQAATAPQAGKQEAAPAVPAKKFSPPQSWRPTVRERWEALPPEVQEEVLRVEGTTRTLVQQAAQARKQAEHWDRMLGGYKPYIQGEPSQWVEGILSQAVQLQTAPAPQRAQLAARILRDAGVDIRLLDEALSGAPIEPRPQQQTAPPDEYRKEIAELREQLQAMQHAPMVEAFVREAEFLDEPMPDGRHTVRDMVAIQLRVAGQSGIALTLKQAYDMVTASHPTIQEALKQRSDAKAQAERNAQTARAQAASSSVRTEPVVGPVADSGGGSAFDDVRASARMLRKS